MSEISLKYPDWGSAYVAAILETNAKFRDKADEAEVAIWHRLESLDFHPEQEELGALQGAIKGLRILRAKRGSGPSLMTEPLLLWQERHPVKLKSPLSADSGRPAPCD